jgi:hypothetical protein
MITVEHFRYDFSQPAQHPFNQAAQDVYVEDFLQVVKEQGWYSTQVIPNEFLEYNVVLEALSSHLKHVYATYREVKSKKRKELWNARVGRSARNSRKGSVGPTFSKFSLTDGH